MANIFYAINKRK